MAKKELIGELLRRIELTLDRQLGDEEQLFEDMTELAGRIDSGEISDPSQEVEMWLARRRILKEWIVKLKDGTEV